MDMFENSVILSWKSTFIVYFSVLLYNALLSYASSLSTYVCTYILCTGCSSTFYRPPKIALDY